MTAAEVLIHLAACIVNGKPPDPAVVAPADEDELMRLAARHQLGAIAATGLKQAGRCGPRVTQELYGAARSAAVYDAERIEVLRRLEAEGIWYLPLKGSVLKNLYPRGYLRQMSDVDILYDRERADDVCRIMESLGYTTSIYDSGHRDDYVKPSVCHVEMHRVLFDDEFFETPSSVYYADVGRLLKKDPDNGYGYHLSDNDFYVYMVAHEYKHYAWGGTGLRSLLDRYVWLKRFRDSVDWAYIAEQTDRLEQTAFEEESRALALKVFAEGSTAGLTERERAMLDYYVDSGAYGTSRHDIENRVEELGKPRYMFNRLFLPMPYIRRFYPFFYKHKALIPFLPVYRLVRGRKNAREELSRLRQVKRDRKK